MVHSTLHYQSRRRVSKRGADGSHHGTCITPRCRSVKGSPSFEIRKLLPHGVWHRAFAYSQDAFRKCIDQAPTHYGYINPTHAQRPRDIHTAKVTLLPRSWVTQVWKVQGAGTGNTVFHFGEENIAVIIIAYCRCICWRCLSVWHRKQKGSDAARHVSLSLCGLLFSCCE